MHSTICYHVWLISKNQILFKSILCLQHKKVNITIEFCTFELGTKFQLKLTILNFGTKFVQKKLFPVENKKGECKH